MDLWVFDWWLAEAVVIVRELERLEPSVGQPKAQKAVRLRSLETVKAEEEAC